MICNYECFVCEYDDCINNTPERQWRYNHSEKGKAAQKRYAESEKGKAAQKRRQQKRIETGQHGVI